MSLVVHLAYCRNDLGPARSAAAALREISDEHGLGFYIPSAQVQQGWVLAMDGEVDEGLALMRAGIAGLKRAGALVENPFNTLLLVDGLLLAELPADAVAVLDETLAQVERTGERCLETELLRMRGEARAAHGAVQADVGATSAPRSPSRRSAERARSGSTRPPRSLGTSSRSTFPSTPARSTRPSPRSTTISMSRMSAKRASCSRAARPWASRVEAGKTSRG